MPESTELRDGQLDVSVIIPAYNEAAVIGDVVGGVVEVLERTGQTFEVLVVNDGSDDDTAEVAAVAGARTLHHPYNIGNGAAVKTGIRNARGRNLLMMDGDGQHSPDDIPRLLMKMGSYDMVVGARTRESVTHWYRDLANRIYNWFASYVCGRKVDDLTSGFRAIRAEVAREFVYLLPNTFSYPATITLATARSGYSLTYLPIQASRRVGKSKIKPLQDGTRFLVIILKVATQYSPLRVFVPASVALFLLGAGYGLFKVVVLGTRYGPTSAMLMTVSVVVFLIGMVSEQVSQLRMQHTE